MDWRITGLRLIPTICGAGPPIHRNNEVVVLDGVIVIYTPTNKVEKSPLLATISQVSESTIE